MTDQEPLARAEAFALWSAQMIHYMVGNLVSFGTLPANAVWTNVIEAEAHLTKLHPDHAETIQALSELMQERLRQAVEALRASKQPPRDG